jgi:hypothetical protein
MNHKKETLAMYTVKLEKVDTGKYLTVKPAQYPLATLALFLHTDGTRASWFFLDWLFNIDPETNSSGGQTCMLIKHEKIIIVDSVINYDHGYKGAGWASHVKAFVATREQLIEILIQWQNILELDPQPDEVLVTQQDSKVTLIPNFKNNEKKKKSS